MDTFLGRYKNLIVLAIILFAQIVALALQVRRPTQSGDTRLLRLWAISAVTPVEKAVVHTQQWVYNTWRTYAYLRGVRRENRELHAEIGRMKVEDARLDEDARMARRIQALLAFKEQYVDTTVAAQVIGTSGSEQSRILYIDKGSKDGIKPDMAVITPTGIVGKIVQVFPDASQVLPINDQFSGVGAALLSSRLQGILKGSANGATTLQYIMSDEKVEPGEEVITSGGDRIFPKGLPVGRVVSVEPGKDLFLNIRVVPAARLDQVEEVLVVTKILEKMPDTKDLGPLRASDILAERLPTVPSKPEVDAAGNAKPGAANGSTAGTTPATGPRATAAHTGAAGTPTTTKPGIGGAAAATAKPTGVATTSSGTSAGGLKPTKPAAAGATRPPGTVMKPLNDAGTIAAPKRNTTAPTADQTPANGATTEDTTPAPKPVKPAAVQTPSGNPQQPSTPPAGEQPPQ
ncbi:MAG: rod shape-determining protein MreC [Candidatus Korobacteraceae bacterium]